MVLIVVPPLLDVGPQARYLISVLLNPSFPLPQIGDNNRTRQKYREDKRNIIGKASSRVPDIEWPFLKCQFHLAVLLNDDLSCLRRVSREEED